MKELREREGGKERVLGSIFSLIGEKTKKKKKKKKKGNEKNSKKNERKKKNPRKKGVTSDPLRENDPNGE